MRSAGAEENALDSAQNQLMARAYQRNKVRNISGQQTESGSISYGYDLIDQLVAATNSALGNESYSYDSMGNRLVSSSIIPQPGTTNEEQRTYSTNYFFYADEGLIAEYDASGSNICSYGYAPNSLWGNNALWMRTVIPSLNDGGTNYLYYLNDHLGAPQRLVRKNGAIAWGANIDSFGNASVWPSSVVTNNLRFSSQYYDDESGLHYNTMRFYNPGMGRYLSYDPVYDENINKYIFVINSPNMFFDKDGLKLTPYLESVNNMLLEPDASISNAGEADSRWPKSISTVNGCCVKLKGKLFVKLYYNPNITTDPYSYSSWFDSTTLAEHEMWHARINKVWWNKLTEYANRLEACYQPKECAIMAGDLAEKALTYYYDEARLEDGKYDFLSYGGGNIGLRERIRNDNKRIFENTKTIFSSKCGR